jgi:hypothetical protein
MVVHGSVALHVLKIDIMFDLKYLTSSWQPMTKQLDKLRQEGIHGGPNFLT